MTDEAVLTALRARSFPAVVDWKVERRPDWFGDDALHITAVLDDAADEWDFRSDAVRGRIVELSHYAGKAVRSLTEGDAPVVHVGFETVSEGLEMEEERREEAIEDLEAEREFLRTRLAEVDLLLAGKSSE